MLTLLLAALLAQTAHLDDDELYRGAPRLAALLDRSGLAVGPWSVPGVPAPTVRWDARDPLGASGVTSHVFTETGATEAIGAPFCPSGDFSGVDEMDGRCMQARRFDGTDYYSGGDIANINDGSLSFCALMHSTYTGVDNGGTVSQIDPATGYGWALYLNGGQPVFAVRGSTPQTKSVVLPALSGWGVVCGSASVASGLAGYRNGGTPVTTAYPTGATSSTQPFKVGAGPYFANPLLGNLALVAVWPGVELTAAQVKTVSQHIMGIIGSRGEQATYTNTGPVSAWVDGKRETFSDDMPIMSAQIPPGLTGGGLTARGVLSHPAILNKVLYGNTFTSGWTQTGTAVVATTTETPYRDGRTGYKLVDDDAASNESIYQSVNIAALGAGASITVAVTAKADTTGYLHFTYDEQSGCAYVAYPQTACALTSTWKTCVWTYTKTTAACAASSLYFSPIQDTWGAVGQTGVAYVANAQVLFSTASPAGIYCETAAAGVTCGGDRLGYTLAAPIVTAGGAFVGTTRALATWTPLSAAPTPTSNQVAFQGSGADYLHAYYNGAFNFFTSPGGSVIASAAAVSPGVVYAIDLAVNYDLDRYSLRVNGATASSASAFASPTLVNTIHLGTNAAGATQHPGGASISNVRIVK